MVWIREDDPEKFFRRSIDQIEESDLLRWEISVEALCELTGERPVLGALPTRTADDDEV